ncbi:MAG: NGG1p interacting factor NIF3 [Coxiella sp. RIFCSPHIGHO2_12_FULL_44_14]|nr:MAG: NGG1p interacting factor NIF3 [Coxiella sp. RIFCSPHIGHO2_12_FULL_44_14]
MYKIYFYVPESHLESVKQAIFHCGAGKMGNYDCCAWQTLGTGQFRALNGSNPAIGQLNQLAKVREYKVETVCEDDFLQLVLQALRQAHPYEKPAYGYWKITPDGNMIVT